MEKIWRGLKRGPSSRRRAGNNGNKRPWLKLAPLGNSVAQDRMDAGEDEGGEDIAKVKDNEIERPDDDDEGDSLESAAGNFRVKKSRGKEEEEEEMDH